MVLQRKRARLAEKIHRAQASKKAAAEYAELLALRSKEKKEKHHALVMKKRETRATA